MHATLMDCSGVDHSAKESASSDYAQCLLEHFGTAQATQMAMEKYQAVFDTYGEIPLPAEATDADRELVDAWESATARCATEAFKDWARVPDSAYFELSF